MQITKYSNRIKSSQLSSDDCVCSTKLDCDCSIKLSGDADGPGLQTLVKLSCDADGPGLHMLVLEFDGLAAYRFSMEFD